MLAPRPPSAPFTVHPLPSPYWAELTDLWFCHTAGNAHVARLASLDIKAAPGKIMLDKLLLRVHADDLERPDAWRRATAVVRLVRGAGAGTGRQSGGGGAVGAAAAAAAASFAGTSSGPAAAPASASSSPASSSNPNDSPRLIWSPLPCVGAGCGAVVGSVLLELRAHPDPSLAVRLAPSGEVRLLKYQLSNCFRRKTNSDAAGRGDASADPAVSDGHSSAVPMHIDDSSAGSAPAVATSASASPAAASPTAATAAAASSTAAAVSSSSPVSAAACSWLDPSPACLCSTFAVPDLGAAALKLSCSNMFGPYRLENLIAEDLAQRAAKTPISKFLIESAADEDDGEGDEGAGAGPIAAASERRMFIRVSREAGRAAAGRDWSANDIRTTAAPLTGS